MPMNVKRVNLPSSRRAEYIDELRTIYTEMDRAYQATADHYNFNCNGCEDNCCLTRFYHHTHIEYYYILEGLYKLPPEKVDEIRGLAEIVKNKTREADQQGKPVRLMCPLNVDGLCGIYECRPMICRLHGLPHELNKPGCETVYGPGCEAFTEQCGAKKYYPFDRTPFYVKLANLENRLKQEEAIVQRFKYTIAEMLTE